MGALQLPGDIKNTQWFDDFSREVIEARTTDEIREIGQKVSVDFLRLKPRTQYTRQMQIEAPEFAQAVHRATVRLRDPEQLYAIVGKAALIAEALEHVPIPEFPVEFHVFRTAA